MADSAAQFIPGLEAEEVRAGGFTTGVLPSQQIRDLMGRDILVDWAPDVINDLCIQSQKDRMFIQASTGGDPHWAFISRPDDGGRFVRNAGATQSKSKARYPFVEPAPLRG